MNCAGMDYGRNFLGCGRSGLRSPMHLNSKSLCKKNPEKRQDQLQAMSTHASDSAKNRKCAQSEASSAYLLHHEATRDMIHPVQYIFAHRTPHRAEEFA